VIDERDLPGVDLVRRTKTAELRDSSPAGLARIMLREMAEEVSDDFLATIIGDAVEHVTRPRFAS
jgi:hypothetical protein